MATKREVLEAALRGEGALGKAADDEPVFVLRAQDITSPITIDEWSGRVCRATGRTPKVSQALADVTEFREWQRKNPHRTKMPD